MAKNKLGKGLNALVSDTLGEAGETDATMVAVSAVVPHKGQPRTHFDIDDLKELTESIKQHGVLQPILVRPKGSGYEIVAGERRYQASKRAGLKQIPALIQTIEDKELLSLALVENLQRADLNPLEEARGYQTLMQERGLTQAEVAAIVSKSRPAIANSLRLVDLPLDVQGLLEKGKLTSGHARALLSLKTKKDQSNLAKTIIAKHLTVRQTEDLVKDATGNSQSKNSSKPSQADKKRQHNTQEALVAQSALSDILGSKVSVTQKEPKGAGSITIHFENSGELKKILNKIG